jgi:hypothetical protein
MRIAHGVRNPPHHGVANRRLFGPLGRGSAENYMGRRQGMKMQAASMAFCYSQLHPVLPYGTPLTPAARERRGHCAGRGIADPAPSGEK